MQKTASVKNFDSAKIQQGCNSAAWNYVCMNTCEWKLISSCILFLIITIEVYVSAYHSNPIFMENSNMKMNDIFSKSCGFCADRHKNCDHKQNRNQKHENPDHKHENHVRELDKFDHRLDNCDHRIDNCDH